MNLAGKAGGCGYEQTNPIGKRADGTCSNLDADPRSRTDSVLQGSHDCPPLLRRPPARRPYSHRLLRAPSRLQRPPIPMAASRQCDRERRARSAQLRRRMNGGDTGALTSAIDRPRAVPPPCSVGASHDCRADTRRCRNSVYRQSDGDARFRVNFGGAGDDSGRATFIEPAGADGLADACNQSRLLRPPVCLAGRPARAPRSRRPRASAPTAIATPAAAPTAVAAIIPPSPATHRRPSVIRSALHDHPNEGLRLYLNDTRSANEDP